MGKQTLIKKEFLEQLGFRPVSYMNINDDSDTRVLVVYQKGEIALMNFGPYWIVCETGFGGLLLKEVIMTVEELINGMNTQGLALDWGRY